MSSTKTCRKSTATREMIRSARVEDAQALSSLLRQLGYLPTLEQIEQSLTQANRDRSAVYVYETAEEVVGFVAVVEYFYFPVMQNVLRITAICVQEQYRGAGFGGQLLRFVEKRAIEQQTSSLEITCSPQRQQAHEFYRQHGYVKQSYKFVKRLALPQS